MSHFFLLFSVEKSRRHTSNLAYVKQVDNLLLIIKSNSTRSFAVDCQQSLKTQAGFVQIIGSEIQELFPDFFRKQLFPFFFSFLFFFMISAATPGRDGISLRT